MLPLTEDRAGICPQFRGITTPSQHILFKYNISSIYCYSSETLQISSKMMKYRIIENIHRFIDTWDSDSRDASP
jgi:hypothetical protein